jgi:uncharacterized membrane protein
MNDPLFPLLLALRYMHIFGAIALMGATIFMRFALLPAVSKLDPPVKATLHDEVRSRWSKFVMAASGLLLISGVTNLALAGRYDFEPIAGLPRGGYHMIVGVKFLLALPIFFFASLLAGRSDFAKKFQSAARFWMSANLALAVLMVLIGGLLRFVPRELKPTGAATPPAAAQIERVFGQTLPLAAAAK